VFGFVIVIIMALAWMWDSAAQQRAARYAAAESEPAPGSAYGQARESAFPVPPLDLPHYHGVGVGTEAGLSNTGTSPKEVTGA
jgi:hypothetical protein